MDMYLEMEKEESPFVVDDYNSMNPSPYEPKVLTRQMIERRQSIQKTAAIREKEISEKAAVVGDAAETESAAKLAKQAKKQLKKAGSKEEVAFDEMRALEAQDAAAVAVVTDTEAEQQTHVLGCDSPDWRE
ncbi:hypothetical protein BGW39_000025 [Mortierella sp. 14UC]|nr:hypothetical protein BGW39_000025 [Mortierella sp. 14UC]